MFLTNFSVIFFALFLSEPLQPTKITVIKNRILYNFIIFFMIIPPLFYIVNIILPLCPYSIILHINRIIQIFNTAIYTPLL